MLNKPLLKNATVVKDESAEKAEELRKLGVSEEVIAYLISVKGKMLNTGDTGIYSSYRILGASKSENYDALRTEGVSNNLSLYRLTGGCNHLDAFYDEGVEKSEDYDSIPSSKIVDVSNDFATATQQVLDRYLGKTLRVVARTAEGTARYGRYYLFAVDD